MKNLSHNRFLFEDAMRQVYSNDDAIKQIYGNMNENIQINDKNLLNEIVGELLFGAALGAPLAAAAYGQYRRNKEADREHQLAIRREDEARRRHEENLQHTSKENELTRQHSTEENRKQRGFGARTQEATISANRENKIASILLKHGIKDPNAIAAIKALGRKKHGRYGRRKKNNSGSSGPGPNTTP